MCVCVTPGEVKAEPRRCVCVCHTPGEVKAEVCVCVSVCHTPGEVKAEPRRRQWKGGGEDCLLARTASCNAEHDRRISTQLDTRQREKHVAT